jgi:proteasome alpha subunit
MLSSPYDWQEAIGHRAQYIESRVSRGVPVLAASVPAGVVAVTYRRQARKLYEVYDRLMLAGIGQQSDIEALRVAAIDFAHQEGFQRSEQDVSAQRVVQAMSQPIKSSFANFQAAPFVAKALFLEVGARPEADRFYCMEYDGDFTQDSGATWLAGTVEAGEALAAGLEAVDWSSKSVDEAKSELKRILDSAAFPEGAEDEAPGVPPLVFEAAVLRRDKDGDRRFLELNGG